jgi:hypothetical protein
MTTNSSCNDPFTRIKMVMRPARWDNPVVFLPLLISVLAFVGFWLYVGTGNTPASGAISLEATLCIFLSVYLFLFVAIGYAGARLNRFRYGTLLGTLLANVTFHLAWFICDPELYPRNAPRGTYPQWWGLGWAAILGFNSFFVASLSHGVTSFFLGDGPESEATEHAGICVHCDYDLTGNVSGRCPECGASVAEDIRIKGV